MMDSRDLHEITPLNVIVNESKFSESSVKYVIPGIETAIDQYMTSPVVRCIVDIEMKDSSETVDVKSFLQGRKGNTIKRTFAELGLHEGRD